MNPYIFYKKAPHEKLFEMPLSDFLQKGEEDLKSWQSIFSLPEGSKTTREGYQEHYQNDADYFDYFNEEYSAVTRFEIDMLHRQILRSIKHKSDALVLDVGCGKGWLSDAMLPKGNRVISMDISTTNPRKVLLKNAQKNHLGLVADVYALPIVAQSLDYIVAAEIIEHVEDPKRFIAILFDKLKPGGRLVITTPYNEKIEYNMCIHCNQPTPKDAHLHSFTEQSFEDMRPAEAVQEIRVFVNKYLLKLRSHLILKHLPYGVWRFFDGLFNTAFKGETRMCITLDKALK